MLIDSAALTRLMLLKAIRRDGPISRVELAESTGLSKGAVSEITAELIASGMVSEEASSLRERGRPRMMLTITSDALMVVGASLDFHGILELSLVDLAGNLISSRHALLGIHATAESLVRRIGSAIDSFVDDSSFDRLRIAAAAVAIPGVIESSAGILHWFTTLPDTRVPAAQIISDIAGFPVVIENSIDCLARAEHWFGSGPGADDFTIIYHGLSVGLAQYTGGIPRTGLAGLNSEFGHAKTDFSEGARACFCGARGCVTAYSSFLGIAVSQLPDTAEQPDYLEVMTVTPAALEAAAAGEPTAAAAFGLAGRHLGLALANYANTSDPRLILIRTDDARMPALIRKELEAAFAANVMPTLLERTTIEIGHAMPDWRWKGAAALALEQAYLGQVAKKERPALRVINSKE